MHPASRWTPCMQHLKFLVNRCSVQANLPHDCRKEVNLDQWDCPNCHWNSTRPLKARLCLTLAFASLAWISPTSSCHTPTSISYLMFCGVVKRGADSPCASRIPCRFCAISRLSFAELDIRNGCLDPMTSSRLPKWGVHVCRLECDHLILLGFVSRCWLGLRSETFNVVGI